MASSRRGRAGLSPNVACESGDVPGGPGGGSAAMAPGLWAEAITPLEECTFEYIALSIGIECKMFAELTNIFPDLRKNVIDVRKWISAPRQHERVKGYFPDRRVVNQVKASSGFEEAVKRCQEMLRTTGIVVVGCKGGNHRAPTVASQLRCDYVFHCVIDEITVDHIAGIIYTCYGYSAKAHAPAMRWLHGLASVQKAEAYVGWSWYGFDDDAKCADAEAAAYLQCGDIVSVEEVYQDFYVSVTRISDGRRVNMHFAWLLPNSVVRPVCCC